MARLSKMNQTMINVSCFCNTAKIDKLDLVRPSQLNATPKFEQSLETMKKRLWLHVDQVIHSILRSRRWNVSETYQQEL